VEVTRPAWTDERLDDLNAQVTGLSAQVTELRRDMHNEFAAVRRGIGSLQRTIMQIGGGLIGTLVVGILGLIATQL
jgi:hypothetical protein